MITHWGATAPKYHCKSFNKGFQFLSKCLSFLQLLPQKCMTSHKMKDVSHFTAINLDGYALGNLPNLGNRFSRSWLECSLQCIIGYFSINFVCSAFTFVENENLCKLSHFDTRCRNDSGPVKVFIRPVKVNILQL